MVVADRMAWVLFILHASPRFTGSRGACVPNGVTWYLSLLMSKKFPEFSRLFWRSVKSKPGLHPAMQARMWKPGQSGNPAGVSKAYAEAMREILVRSGELSLGAVRTRRWRQKRQQGVSVVRLDVAPDITTKLIRFGWLDASRRGDREAIATALIELARRATELEITPPSRAM